MFRNIKFSVDINIEQIEKYYPENLGGKSIEEMNKSLDEYKSHLIQTLCEVLEIENGDNIKVNMKYEEVE